MRPAALLVLALLFTAGCTAKDMPWTKEAQQWREDLAECQVQGDQAVTATTDPYVRTDTRKRVISDCMGGKG